MTRMHHNHGTPLEATAAAILVLLATFTAGCASRPRPDSIRALSHPEALGGTHEPAIAPANLETWMGLPSLPAAATAEYRLGPGDGLDLHVVGQPELSGALQVGPDGRIALPLAGTIDVQGATRDEAAGRVAEILARYFRQAPRVSVEVTEYENNKAYVLGRVERPGVVDLTGAGTLLQALSEAGGLPVREFRSFLAKCAIIRGRDQILWIDLIDLLQGGDISLNVPLRNGDVVFIPDSEDAIVFVMGEVASPGAVPIKVRIDLVQALAHAGGPTEDADLEAVYLVRADENGGFGQPLRIDFKALLETSEFHENVELRTGDIVHVARNGLGEVNYVLRKLEPALTALTLGAALR